MTTAPVLTIRGVEVVFDGFRAIDGVDLTVNEGELRFLIGPNGAGKTTLVDVITGMTRPTAGSVRFRTERAGTRFPRDDNGVELVGRREFEVVRLGISRTFQTAFVFEHLTVLENLDLASSFRMKTRSMFRRRRDADSRVIDALETTHLTDLAAQSAGTLSHGQRQWLEIGMLLVQEPSLLLLDEPVAGMSKDERQRTGELLQRVARDRTVVVIEHDMAFLRDFASVVTVLHQGKVLREGSVTDIQNDPQVQEVYLGRSKVQAGTEAQ